MTMRATGGAEGTDSSRLARLYSGQLKGTPDSWYLLLFFLLLLLLSFYNVQACLELEAILLPPPPA